MRGTCDTGPRPLVAAAAAAAPVEEGRGVADVTQTDMVLANASTAAAAAMATKFTWKGAVIRTLFCAGPWSSHHREKGARGPGEATASSSSSSNTPNLMGSSP